MSRLRLAWRSLTQRRLSSALTILSIGLGVALTIAIMALRAGAEGSYHNTARGYDAILGPTHGSPLQIVLNTMFHVGDAGGTIPWQAYEDAKADGQVKYAVPYAVGDMFHGHHVVGTSSLIFKALEDGDAVPLGEEVRGRIFTDGLNWEAVVGSMCAARTGLVRGSTFRVTHGVGTAEHGETWTVVGILRPTGTPADRAIFIPIETFYEIGDHGKGADYQAERRKEREAEREKAAAEAAAKGKGKNDGSAGHGHAHADNDDEQDDNGHAHDDDEGHAHEEGGEEGHAHEEGDGHVHGTKEELGLSAVGIRLKSPILRLRFVADMRSDRGPVQAVIPQDQVRELFDIISPLGKLLTWIVIMMVIVAGIGTMVGLYNTIHGRRREIAILRAVGAKPLDVFVIIITEALLLCMLGGVFGLLLGHATVILIAPFLLTQAGVFLSAGFSALDAWILLVLVGFGFIIGLLPAFQGLRTPVAANLHPTE
ncbi:MAG: ABC transporter permease [Planctomycetota bacterium]|nr:ABC transporter permease [Planctomycetota bacterium]